MKAQNALALMLSPDQVISAIVATARKGVRGIMMTGSLVYRTGAPSSDSWACDTLALLSPCQSVSVVMGFHASFSSVR